MKNKGEIKDLATGTMYLVEKDIIEWFRNKGNLIYGYLMPIIMFFIINSFSGNQGMFSIGTGIIYMSTIYTSIYISSEPLFSELIYKTSIELYMSPRPKEYIIVGKLLSGIIKSISMTLVTMIILRIFVIDVNISITAILSLILFVINCVSFSILISNFIKRWSIFAGVGGVMGILSAILAGVFMPLPSMNIIFRVIAYILPTTGSYQLFLFELYGKSDIYSVYSLTISIVFPILSIIISSKLYKGKISKNVCF